MDKQDIKVIIAHKEYEKGKEQLMRIEKNSWSYKNWFVAASILLLVSSFTYFFFLNEVNTEQLFQENFDPYTNIIAPISRNDKSKTNIEIAFENYELKNYKKAIEDFNQLKTSSKLDLAIINFYIAVSELAEDNTANAIKILVENTNVPNSWKDKYLWYLSLAYLKNNNLEKAKLNLTKLSKLKSNFKETETLMLLKKLN